MTYRPTKQALRELQAVAATQGGYFTAKQAAGAGYGYPHLAYHLEAGNFERAGRGLYRLPFIPLSNHDELIRLALWSRDRADNPQATVSHRTALGLYELGDLLPGAIDLTVPPTYRKRPPRGVVLHHAVLAAQDTREHDGFRATTPLRTLLDAARTATVPLDQLKQAVHDALARGLVRRSVLAKSASTTGLRPDRAAILREVS